MPYRGSLVNEAVPPRGLPEIGTATAFACSAKCESVDVAGASAAASAVRHVGTVLRGCEPRTGKSLLGARGCGCSRKLLGSIIVMGDDRGFLSWWIIVMGDDPCLVELVLFIALIADLMTGRRAVTNTTAPFFRWLLSDFVQSLVVQSFAVSVLRHLGMRVLKRLRILRGSVEISDTSNSILRPLLTLPTCLTLTSTMTDAHCIRVVHWVVVIDDRTERAALPLASGSSAIR